MLSQIKVNEEFQHYTLNPDAEDYLKSLSRINVFIGKNNSGKSMFLRHLFSSNKLEFKLKNIDLTTINSVIERIRNTADLLNRTLHAKNYTHQLNDLMRLPSVDSIQVSWKSTEISSPLHNIRQVFRYSHTGIEHQISHSLETDVDWLISSLNDINIQSNIERHYVPVLRGMRPIQVQSTQFIGTSDNYKQRTVKDYFEDSADSSNIITGLHLYEETKRLLLGSLNDRNRVKEFEEFLSETFFENLPFSIIPRIDDDVIHVRIGSTAEDEFPIYKLGDGIQAIIILTYPLFFYKGTNALICFEEPETHLHPGLQRLFIETLMHSDFASFQYFITTHSNHILDLTADYDNMAVYSFSKNRDENKFQIDNVENEHGNVLELIGARVSSVFLSNCTIWVEGITDRIYLRKYLEIYQQSQSKKFNEDFHYSFVEYGGNNITHWSFLDSDDPNHPNINVEKLCGKIFLITDKDNAGLKMDGGENKKSHKKYERHRALETKLKSRYYCLECIEIENLLGIEIIKKVIQKRERKQHIDFTQLDKVRDISNEKLGRLIDERVPNASKTYAANSGTINNKLEFCKSAISEIHSTSDLSEEAFRLSELLYKFIASHN